MNHSGLLLMQAKEIITEAEKNASSNIALLKLTKEMKSQLVKETPTQMTIQRDMFENFENFKLQTRINKFQVEDLYIKRENGLPIEILEEIEKEEEEKKAHMNMLKQRLNGNNSSLLISNKQLEPALPNYVSVSSLGRFKSSASSPIKHKTNNAHTSYQGATSMTEENIKILTTNGHELEEVDIFNLNNNINKFSYQNVKNEKELRELKLSQQHQTKAKTIERVQKKLQLKQNIERYKD